MIRIRKADGSVIEVPRDGHFVELVSDADGSVGSVVYSIQPGVISRIIPGSEDARRYAQMFAKQGVKFSDQMIER